MTMRELIPVEALVSPAPVAVAGFLAGYSGRTREAYALDLRMFGRWCAERDLDLLAAQRAHIELSARWLEEQGRARATIARRRRNYPRRARATSVDMTLSLDAEVSTCRLTTSGKVSSSCVR